MKKLLQIGTAFVLSLSSLMAIALPAAYALNNSCQWIGTDSASFNNSANWENCGGNTPGAGDSLIFSNSSNPGGNGYMLLDNLPNSPGAPFANITFEGNGSTQFVISGDSNTIYLTGNMTDSTSTTGAIINMPVEFQTDGSNSLVTADNHIYIGSSVDNEGSLTLEDGGSGLGSLTVGGTGNFSSYGALSSGGSYQDSLDIGAGGTGTFIEYSASPSFTGAINVSGGAQVSLSSTGSTLPDMFSASPLISVASGGVLDFSDSSATSGTIAEPISAAGTGAITAALASGGNLDLSGATTLTANSDFSSTATITLSGTLSGLYTVANPSGTLDVNSSDNTSNTPNGTYLNGSLQSGNAGSPTVTPITSGTNAPTLTINVGNNEEYLIDGTVGATTVSSGGLLKGNGTVNGLDVATGGTVAPGHSPGCITDTGNFTEAGTYQADIQSPGDTACTDFDQIIVSGTGSTVNLTGGTLDTNPLSGFTPAVGQTFDILKNEGGSAITGTFNGLAEGAVFSDVNGTKYQITYKGGTSGNDVVLSVVSPTASTTVASGVGSTPATVKAPKTPDTGFALTSASVAIPLISSIAVAAGLIVISRKVKKPLQE